jgi:hypothetical protein
MNERTQAIKTYNNIYYGQAVVFAIDMNKWVLPGCAVTTSHVRARNAAIKMNRMMGGVVTDCQKMSAGLPDDS